MRIEEACGMSSTATPKVGDKCTMHLYSDSHACQVVRVSASGKTMWIKRNKVEHESGTASIKTTWRSANRVRKLFDINI